MVRGSLKFFFTSLTFAVSFAVQAQPRVLISAFEPFGGRRENATQEILREFTRLWEESAPESRTFDLGGVVVPVAYDFAEQELARKMDSFQPDIVLSLGEAPEGAVRLEEMARNRDDSPFADNRGVARMDEKIVEDGPNTYKTRLPIKVLEQALKKQNISVRRSRDAGAYLCNHLFYQLMHFVNTESDFKSVRAGFIHFPAESIEDTPDYPERGASTLGVILRTILQNL